ncbi:hypothetical protein Celaphus_00012342 [Cervus elaphus hippelaphus]|uniref:Ig-like domain-containing protein n=1 Tax=Cervus elaphus hippelaphus TaxID=46360 RepID=A0A212CLD3_CEREH|nr:hypothetical protein Celaphus_00012342 [Cervus elaphus hippelaphus]
MCPTFTCFTVLCLLGAGFLEAEVTQTPGHLVQGKGLDVEMYCVPEKGHIYVFWYQQILAKEFKFLISFQNDKVLDDKEMPKKRFLAECPSDSPCSLKIQATEPQDSAMYFCASSDCTVRNIG